MRFGYLAAIDTGASVLSIAVAVIMAVKGYGYWALVAREVVRSALKAVGAWVAMPWIPGLPSRSPDVVPMLRFAGNVTGFNVLRLTSASIGQGLVGRVFGAESLGIYRQALQLILVPIQHLNGPLRSVGDVALSRLQADTLRYRRFYQKFLGLTSFVTLPAMSLVLILAHDIVQIVLGVRWIDAAPVLRVTALAGLFGPLVTTAVAVALSCGHAGRLLRYAVLELAGLSLFFVLGLRWGIVGVASAHLWVACCVGLPAIYWLFKDTPIGLRLFMSTIARPALATGVMAIALLLFRAVVPIATPSVAVVSSGAVAAAVYLLALVVPRGGPEFVAGLLSRHARATAAPGVVT
jgi:PST family polysaccharide transporter